MIKTEQLEKEIKKDHFKIIKNIGHLGGLKIKLHYKKLSNLILFSFFIISTLVINSLGLFYIKTPATESLLSKINILILVLSLVLFITTIYITVSIFKEEISSNVHSLELRYGYKTKELFLSRVFGSGAILLIAYLSMIVINLFFGLPESNLISIFAYRLYISSLAWYIMVIFIGYTLAIFFTSFINSIFSMISLLLAFFVIVLGVISGGEMSKEVLHMEVTTDTEYVYSPKQMYKNKKMNEVTKIMNNLFPGISEQYLSFLDLIVFDESSFPLTANVVSFGPKVWQNWDELTASGNYKEIVDLYTYFSKYFDEHKFSYTYNDVTGLVGDNRQEKIEPVANLLNIMRKQVDNKYRDLVNALFRFNHDQIAMRLLNINYEWNIAYSPTPSIRERQLKEIKDFIETKQISPAEAMFYKLLNKSFYVNNLQVRKWNFDFDFDIIVGEGKLIIDETRKYVELQQKKIIYNPFIQFATIFNSVNYYDFYLDNVITSSEYNLGGTTNFYYSPIEKEESDDSGEISNMTPFWENYESSRTIYPELIYVAYTLISCLIIFGSYFKFKRNVTKN